MRRNKKMRREEKDEEGEEWIKRTGRKRGRGEMRGSEVK